MYTMKNNFFSSKPAKSTDEYLQQLIQAINKLIEILNDTKLNEICEKKGITKKELIDLTFEKSILREMALTPREELRDKFYAYYLK